MTRLFPNLLVYDRDGAAWRASDKFLTTGAIHDRSGPSHAGLGRILRAKGEKAEIILFEQGFLASAYSWIESYRDHRPEAACLGYVYDDIAHYYMAEYPNRLIERLNGPQELTADETKRAQSAMNRIRDRRISKYNSQPLAAPSLGNAERRKVLVCDQSFADASTVYGLIDETGFEEMLAAAVRENADADILVKTHPDTASRPKGRAGYFSHLSDHGRVRILRDPINPYALFEHVDTVYVGTSGMGLEALFAGKRVVCFGAPFYAGWGLTDDRREIPHRHRSRSLEDIFHAFYIWYTIYHVPGAPVPSRIEDALDYIEKYRPVKAV
ncbi:hypothetical protein [Qingshengfaniella alkalisoli]|uniref:Capsular polysaccharide export protein n=1 Tax=Qingshengfaniella alkalisoli TaxID=2599296 RepID=A0A5B8I8N3_9RHOB|nr:hypothetical protein [Qingshengfaniella alkalisoli]QDY70405.1 hypothetical protein FPZ52_11810 [Qingshengfaniella alkalisoli]